ncbi:tetratricopeptide repeat protein [Solwaraspora sp. WMMD406]|uniref:tetratricopeptide repeat protein n=1 Tax=Solwaraspora sp. WMMD406 TaxID=3016095 RepID=UPI0024173771|nr:tetratricopeptide repeat protein [Solwaraspora sp. WMMD406]MDG4767823.1 tetratricopeptide repeat protein [Solwaraspora sp. WMMD406]
MTISRLLRLLRDADVDPQPTAVADALWLARYLPDPAGGDAPGPTGQDVGPGPGSPDAPRRGPDADPVPGTVAAAGTVSADERDLAVYAVESAADPGREHLLELRAPAASALPGALAISRALRPLRRTVADPHRMEIDEERTIEAIAETELWLPLWRHGQRRWLDLRLVTDLHTSMAVWHTLVDELITLVQGLGVFRDVRTGELSAGTDGRLRVTGAAGHDSARQPPPAGGGSLVLLVSDCVAPYWHDGSAYQLMQRWGRRAAVAVLQPLPQRLWPRTGLVPERGRLASRGAPTGPVTNADLRFTPYRWRPDRRLGSELPIPVLEIEPDWLIGWTRLLAGSGRTDAMITLPPRPGDGDRPPTAADPTRTPIDRVRTFQATASPQAFRLATYLSAAPTTLSVMRLVQQSVIPVSRPCHLAEVLLGGLLARVPSTDTELRFRFMPGVQALLSRSLLVSDLQRIRYQISGFLADQLGISMREFTAAVSAPSGTNGALGVESAGRPFAALPAPVVARLGDRFRDLVEPIPDSPIDSGDRSPDNAGPPAGDQDTDTDTDALADRRRQLADLLDRIHRWDAEVMDRVGAAPAGPTNRPAGELGPVLDEAVYLLRDLIRRRRPPPGATRELAALLRIRYEMAGEPADLTEALSLIQDALDRRSPPAQVPPQTQVPPDDQVPPYDQVSSRPAAETDVVAEAALIRMALFRRDGRASDLTEGIRLARVAVAATAEDGPILIRRRIALAEALLTRFAALAAPADLDEALAIYTAERDRAPDTSRVELLARIADLHRVRYRRGNGRRDLDAAIAATRAVVAARGKAPGSAADTTSLAELLHERFAVTGDEADLRKAADLYASAASLAPDATDRVRAVRGRVRAVAQLLRRDPDPDRHDPDPDLLDADPDLLDAVIAAGMSVVEPATADDRQTVSHLDTMAGLLALRAGRRRERHRDDRSVEIRLLRHLLDLVPVYHPKRPDYLYRLGVALQHRYRDGGELNDLWEAGERFRTAVEFTPANQQPTARYLAAYAEALAMTGEQSGNRSDLERARRVMQQAIHATPSLDAALPQRSWRLAEILLALGQPGPAADRMRLVVQEFARSRGPDDEETLRARTAFGRLLGDLGRYGEAADELTSVVDVLVQRHGPDHPAVLAIRRDAIRAGQRRDDGQDDVQHDPRQAGGNDP